MPAASLITDNQIILLDVQKMREHGISVQEFVSMIQLGVYPMLDIYTVRKKDEAMRELMDYSS